MAPTFSCPLKFHTQAPIPRVLQLSNMGPTNFSFFHSISLSSTFLSAHLSFPLPTARWRPAPSGRRRLRRPAPSGRTRRRRPLRLGHAHRRPAPPPSRRIAAGLSVSDAHDAADFLGRVRCLPSFRVTSRALSTGSASRSSSRVASPSPPLTAYESGATDELEAPASSSFRTARAPRAASRPHGSTPGEPPHLGRPDLAGPPPPSQLDPVPGRAGAWPSGMTMAWVLPRAGLGHSAVIASRVGLRSYIAGGGAEAKREYPICP